MEPDKPMTTAVAVAGSRIVAAETKGLKAAIGSRPIGSIRFLGLAELE
jgi:hypothetical protein